MSTIEQAYQWFQSGQIIACEQTCRTLLLNDERTPGAHHLLGLLAMSRNDPQKAIEHMRAAVRWAPQTAIMHIELGNALRLAGDPAQAEACYRQATQLDPESAVAHNNLGSILRDQKRISEALLSLIEAARLWPDAAVVHVNLGECYQGLYMVDEARAAFERAIALDGTLAAARFKLATLLQRQNELDQAAMHYRTALTLEPEQIDLQRAAGVALHMLGDKATAKSCYRKVLVVRPNDNLVLNNLAEILCGELQFAEAEQLLKRRIANAPSDENTHFGVATCLVNQGRFAESLPYYEAAMRVNPENAEVHYYHGMTRLLLGDFEAGWPEFEWRSQATKDSNSAHAGATWRGEPLEGRPLLVYSEGGFGDTIHFIRYVPLIQNPGGKVFLEVPPNLIPLLEQSGFENLIPQGQHELATDTLKVSLVSLPAIFDTRLETIPAPVRYLSAAPELRHQWQQRLAPYPNLRVGIHWQGSADAKQESRWIPPVMFETLLRIPNTHFVSLQRDASTELATRPALQSIVQFEGLDQQGAFMDTAAIIENLDLVITSDTSIVHLAGALNKPTWVALPVASDWRWMTDRSDTPWYPSLRFFRKKGPGDWTEVFNRIADELAKLAAAFRARA